MRREGEGLRGCIWALVWGGVSQRSIPSEYGLRGDSREACVGGRCSEEEEGELVEGEGDEALDDNDPA
jgi:hypothetical protein